MKRAVLSLLVVALCAPMAADEGMWTFDSFPRAAVKQKYGVDVTDAWLASLRSRMARLENGCTGSFVSGSGLVLTNHHCAQSCLAENSTRVPGSRGGRIPGRDRRPGNEMPERADLRAGRLGGRDGARARPRCGSAPAAEATTARNKAFTSLEQACEERAAKDGTPLKCETVTLYQGGQYLALQVQALHRRPPRLRARIGGRGLRRRPRQLPVPAVVSRHDAAARLRERQARRHARSPDGRLGRRGGGRRRCSSPGTQDRPTGCSRSRS